MLRKSVINQILSFNILLFNVGYISKEHECDINTQGSPLSSNNPGAELEIDIARLPTINVNSTTQIVSIAHHQSVIYSHQPNSSISSENFFRKREIKELEINTQINRKRPKIGDNLISKQKYRLIISVHITFY
ncbi:2794_t:CDS:2 [Funneliformis caledonium]|uniref:2794_t:CDS:1 n=1 Tax=Funneliformis caledonium TaxID=1117310 RepID=A0A9N9GKH2_9GLOM|nr:2794_t:CDS:2 [Funneliformis caledonium]